jgi:hypothetical protein
MKKLPPVGDGICASCKEFAMLYRLSLCLSCTKKLGTGSVCVANRLVEEISKGDVNLTRVMSDLDRRTA